MNKKFLSAILFGALALASTGSFVSCKDYDDDIKNLQTQITTLATKADVETKLGQLQSALSSAQSAAQTAQSTAEAAKKEAAEALAAAKAADNSAEVKKLEDQIKALDAEIAAQKAELAKIEEAQKAVDAALEAVKAEVAEQLAEFDKATQEKIAEAQKKTEETVGKVADYVTAVEFLNAKPLSFTIGQVAQDFVFGEKQTDAQGKEVNATSKVTYKKDAWFSYGPANQIVVRVSPSNAVLTKEMVKVVNGKGENLDIVEVADVKPYSADITRAIGTGLWSVDLKLAEGVTDEDFAAAQKKETKEKLYAVAVNNTESAPERNVLTSFALSLADKGTYKAATATGDTRFQSVETMAGDGNYRLLSKIQSRPAGSTRAGEDPIPAKNGEKIHVSFPDNSPLEYFYIVRDDSEAKLAQNELNAWKSYSYTGINEICKVSEGTDFSVTIPESLATGDEIAFRLYAVNYNGTLAVEKGVSFVVYVGKNDKIANVTGNLTAVAGKTDAYTTGWLKLDGTLVNKSKDADALLKKVTPNYADNKPAQELSIEYSTDGKKAADLATVEYKDIKYVKFTATKDNFKAWTDDATATATLTTYDAKKLKENVIKVTLTKVLPDVEATKANMSYKWKDNQLVNGVYTSYLTPTAWKPTVADNKVDAVASATKNMSTVISDLKGNAYIGVANAALTEAKDDPEGKQYYKNILYTSTDYTLTVSNKPDDAKTVLIDNKTQHDLTIGYNYGAISSKNDDEVRVDVETQKIIFSCALETTVQSFSWKQRLVKEADEKNPAVYEDVNVVTYKSGWTSKSDNLADYLIAENAFDNSVFGGKFSSIYAKYYANATAKLTSNGSGKEDYFTVTIDADGKFTFEDASETDNPTADVASTLEITLYDTFGHKLVYKMPFTVKRATGK